MASWLMDFILGREHKETVVKVPEYDPFTDTSLHKIERMDEYLKAMERANRCPVHGRHYGYGEFSDCYLCKNDYYTMITLNEDKVRAMGIELGKDVIAEEFQLFRIAANWLDHGEITEAEAKAYGLKLEQSVKAHHQQRLERERQLKEQEDAAVRPARRLSELISK